MTLKYTTDLRLVSTCVHFHWTTETCNKNPTVPLCFPSHKKTSTAEAEWPRHKSSAVTLTLSHVLKNKDADFRCKVWDEPGTSALLEPEAKSTPLCRCAPNFLSALCVNSSAQSPDFPFLSLRSLVLCNGINAKTSSVKTNASCSVFNSALFHWRLLSLSFLSRVSTRKDLAFRKYQFCDHKNKHKLISSSSIENNYFIILL